MSDSDILLYIFGLMLLGATVIGPVAYHIGKIDGRDEQRSYPNGFRRCRHESHRREKA